MRIILLSLLITLCTVVRSEAQRPEKLFYDFETLRSSYIWSGSYNPASLAHYKWDNISYVETEYRKENGGFREYYGSDNSYSYGIKTESFAKVKKLSFYGKLGYDFFEGNNMTWSGLIHPDKFMIKVADDVPSDKKMEHYYIAGAISAPLARRLTGGFSIEYNGKNLSKMRDLRHETNYMSLNLKAGLIYETEYLNLGLSYLFEKYYEKVSYSRVSNTDEVFKGYYLKGLWFGLQDSWDNSSLHLESSISDYLPFNEHYNGVAAQAEVKLGEFSLLNEFAYKGQRGYVGMGGEHIYNTTSSSYFEYYGAARYSGHSLWLKTNYMEGAARDNIFTRQVVNGETIIVKYGSVELFSKKEFNLTAGYRFISGNEYNPRWDLNILYKNFSRSSVSYMIVPYFYSQRIHNNSISLSLRRAFFFESGTFEIALRGGYCNGYGEPLTEHLSDIIEGSIEEGSKPKPVGTLLNREYEYYTTPKREVGIKVGGSYMVGKKMALYANVNYDYLSAANVIYATGSDAHSLLLAIGIRF